MALKRKIKKAEYYKLSEDIKLEYVEKDGEFVLDIEGDEDTSALKRAKDREAQQRRDAEEKLREAKEELEKLQGNDARKNGDIETLEKSWKKKQEETENSYKEVISKKDAFIQSSLVETVAQKIASKISSAPALIMPHIKARLKADLDGDTPSTKILDANGQLSSMTIEELENEFVANKDFSAIIVGSKASGSSTANDGKDRSTRVGGMTSDGKPVQLSALAPKELAETIKASKERQE